jgi:hypothetical protein
MGRIAAEFLVKHTRGRRDTRTLGKPEFFQSCHLAAMKTITPLPARFCPIQALLIAAAGLIGFPLNPCQAQTTTKVKDEVTTAHETRVDGLLHLTGPESVTVKVRNSDPATYRYGRTIQFVDEAGNVVAREQIPPGTPVTVYAITEPTGGIVTNRVVVHKRTATTTAPGVASTKITTTVTETEPQPTKIDGVLMEKEPDRVLVTTEKNGNLTFKYTRDTEFIDSDGKHVDLINMVPGMPVQVDFLQVGDRLEAHRVIVRGRVKE